MHKKKPSFKWASINCIKGFSLVKKLKSQLQTSMIPVILLTSKGEVESEVEGLEAGADDYIPKPIVANRLLARINRTMSIYGQDS